MRSFSLKGRIGICIAGLMILVVTIISVIAYQEFQEALLGSLDSKLQSDLSTVKYLLLAKDSFSPETQKEVRSFLNPQKETQEAGYQIWLEGNDDVTGSLASMDIYDAMKKRQISAPDPDGYILSNMTQEQKTYRVIWARYPVANRSTGLPQFLNIALATSSTYAYHEIGEFTKMLFILGGIILWITLMLIQGILKWGLKPVDLLAHRMRDVSGSNLSEIHRDYPNAPKELLPFVKSWEEMLDKLAHTMEEQKRFISDAAHELRTPIAIIKSTLQLAQSKKRSVEFYEETITRALEDIERLNALIEQLLQLSRLENADNLRQWEVVNIANLIEDIVEQYEPLVNEKGFRLNTQLCPAQIRGNPHQIRQLMLNLIDNAVQYAPPQTTITLSVEIHDKMAVITVHDEGSGIPEDECPRLFDRFYRVSKARDRNSGGSGLGLAIAKEIAILHSGNITIESNSQNGTSFVVTLPINRECC
ncbi:MAG: GHKL domain-containing protein [Phycisphaerae bacterium]|nr:GHKL domain-containing protein [Phycisphaerae bacterium]